MLREYEVKYGYKFKRTIKQKNKVGAFCLGIGYFSTKVCTFCKIIDRYLNGFTWKQNLEGAQF
jgi:hypothetical protein